MRIDPPAPQRVGITYHPFLHGAIAAHRALFDAVEIPLDLYADEARRGLLDPGLARLRDVAAGRALLWRGPNLSSDRGDSPDRTELPPVPARVVEAVGPAPVSVAISPSEAGGGEVAAHALGLRCEALRSLHPYGLVLHLDLGRLAEAGRSRSRAWLAALAAATACSFGVIIGPNGLDPDAAAEILGVLAHGRVAHVVLAALDAAAWAALDAALATTGARSVVVRRERNLFPIGDILDAATRCRDALGRAASPSRPAAARRPTPPSVDPIPPTPTIERGGAAARAAMQVWREHVRDLHRAQQLARWAARPEAMG